MATVMRLKRMGQKKAPYYRIVVTDQRNKRDGGFIETIGTYQPVMPNPLMQKSINKERAEYWLSVGTQPSETVWSILKKFGINKPIKKKKSKKPAAA